MADESETCLPGPVKLVVVGVIVIVSIGLRLLVFLGGTVAVLALVDWFYTSAIQPVIGRNTAVLMVLYGVCIIAWFKFAYRIVTSSKSGSPYTTASDIYERIPRH